MQTIKQYKAWILREEIEDRLFYIALTFAPFYFGLNIFNDLIQDLPLLHLALDILFLVISIAFYFLRRVLNKGSVLIFIFCILILSGFIYFWYSSSGIHGSGSYIFPVLAALVLLINRGFYLHFFSAVLLILTFILVAIPATGIQNTYSELVFELILNLTILAILLVLFKLALDKEQADLESQNLQLDDLNKDLAKKSAELTEYNAEIELIHENLEQLVNQKTKVLNEENKRDSEYSFINAHLVRAPIANILAIIEQSDSQNPKLIELKSNVQELDTIVRKIGKVLAGDLES
ncbi:hypothetical protein SAMN05421640_1967 [Ekhidna lutea]|uniref:Signal transduction histidine kinase dimerisation/phosphoacceptor domain-containing protein n=1 Tax=Ekhidna lutea TaxID=447679 RepID=A0A239J6N3_EKHLU|nr:hypothetical protein [Ekhidna lutea]SNT00304.1 hypothetical protein SAMN05421640_1967 [Ekhidna lutea]